MTRRLVAASRRLLALALFGLVLPLVRAEAQGTSDVLTGTVTGPEKQPLEGAIVEVRATEGAVTRRTTTNAKGRYVIVFPDGAGQYRLTVRAIGFAPVTRAIQRIGDDDRIITDVALSSSPVQLQEIVARGRQAPPTNIERPPPGTSERVFDAERNARLPLDASDIAALAALTPGVVTSGASDSTPAQINVGGQAATANNVTLDGLSFGADLLPQDGIRSTRVVTNSYDVARGQFSGGQISTTTRSGTNVVQGSFTTILRDNSLAAGDGTDNAFGGAFDQQQLSGGFGGPIAQDRLFFYLSGQGRFRRDPLPSLLDADAFSLQRLGVASDSAARFLTLAQGTGAGGVLAAGQRRSSDAGSGLLRLDWLVGEQHTLTFRGDYRDSGTDPSRVGPLALPGTGGTTRTSGGGAFLSLNSRFGTRFINEVRGYWSQADNSGAAFQTLPTARVLVTSELDDGSQGIATLGFGGSTGLPNRGQTRGVEVTEELQFLPGDGTHRLKLGLLVANQSFDQDITANRFGTFFYQSLDDLAANRPATFSRTLEPVIRRGEFTNTALWLGDIWRTSNRLQLTYGVRAEQTTYGGAPANNASVEQLFGLRTDRLPSEVRLSPRLGFTWTLPGPQGQPPRTFVRGGVGEFRSVVPVTLLGALQGLTGLSGSEQQLLCVGADSPAAEWSRYAADPATIPTTCASGFNSGGLQQTAPTVAVLGNDFASPRAVRASLGVNHRIWSTFTIGLDASVARGRAQSGVRDVNLQTTPAFGLANEGGRPVFVPAAAIDAATGQLPIAASRVDPSFGRVLVVESDLANTATQLTASLGGLTRRGALLNVSYTWSRVRDQSSFAGGSPQFGFDAPTTAGNPNLREWAASTQERRHQIVGFVTYPVTPGLEITGTIRALSGAPFTPLVSGDINGDGGRQNDRAFVFAPSAVADPASAAALTSVLAANSCLVQQSGQVAARNSCRGPWQPAFDLQLNWRPSLFGLDRRFTASLTTVNLMGGLDQLLHDNDNLKGWGGFVRPDPVLLAVTGFDPGSRQYRYAVNERFGTTAAGTSAFRTPFQVGVQFRYTLGPDPVRDRLRAAFGGQGGGAGAAAGGPGGPGGGFGGGIARLLENNPLKRLLAIDSLALTAEQKAQLQPLSDSLDARGKVAIAEFQQRVEKAGANPDFAALFGGLRPTLEAAQRAVRASLDSAQKILTPEQWAKVPADIKTPFGGFGGPGAGRRGPGAGGRP